MSHRCVSLSWGKHLWPACLHTNACTLAPTPPSPPPTTHSLLTLFPPFLDRGKPLMGPHTLVSQFPFLFYKNSVTEELVLNLR